MTWVGRCEACGDLSIRDDLPEDLSISDRFCLFPVTFRHGVSACGHTVRRLPDDERVAVLAAYLVGGWPAARCCNAHILQSLALAKASV